MTELDVTSYAVVVPEKLVATATRVPVPVRSRLNIRLFGVDMDGCARTDPSLTRR